MLAKLFTSSTGMLTYAGGSRRMFSRADILKSLDRNKVNRKTFIKKELTENPEFFKAFPHMQALFSADKEESKGGAATAGEEAIDENARYQENEQIGFKDPSGRSDASYFESLFHQHNHYLSPKDKEEAIRENERNFVEAYLSPQGPNKWMSKEEIEYVHSQVDKRL
jgi:hypothetical protein